MILSLDISSVSTGWAKFSGVDLISTGTIVPCGSTHAESLVQFQNTLENLMDGITEVVIEDVWSGRNKKVYKILSLYHGIAYAVCWRSLQKEPTVLMPSRVRKICEAVYGDKLSFREREEAKKAVFDFAIRLYSQLSHLSIEDNDITDAVAIGLAHHWLERAIYLSMEAVKASNPKLRSVDSIRKKALAKAEDYLEAQYVKSSSDAGSVTKRNRRRNKKSLQKTST